jgi:hypothetical protein
MFAPLPLNHDRIARLLYQVGMGMGMGMGMPKPIAPSSQLTRQARRLYVGSVPFGVTDLELAAFFNEQVCCCCCCFWWWWWWWWVWWWWWWW